MGAGCIKSVENKTWKLPRREQWIESARTKQFGRNRCTNST